MEGPMDLLSRLTSFVECGRNERTQNAIALFSSLMEKLVSNETYNFNSFLSFLINYILKSSDLQIRFPRQCDKTEDSLLFSVYLLTKSNEAAFQKFGLKLLSQIFQSPDSLDPQILMQSPLLFSLPLVLKSFSISETEKCDVVDVIEQIVKSGVTSKKILMLKAEIQSTAEMIDVVEKDIENIEDHTKDLRLEDDQASISIKMKEEATFRTPQERHAKFASTQKIQRKSREVQFDGEFGDQFSKTQIHPIKKAGEDRMGMPFAERVNDKSKMRRSSSSKYPEFDSTVPENNVSSFVTSEFNPSNALTATDFNETEFISDTQKSLLNSSFEREEDRLKSEQDFDELSEDETYPLEYTSKDETNYSNVSSQNRQSIPANKTIAVFTRNADRKEKNDQSKDVKGEYLVEKKNSRTLNFPSHENEWKKTKILKKPTESEINKEAYQENYFDKLDFETEESQTKLREDYEQDYNYSGKEASAEELLRSADVLLSEAENEKNDEDFREEIVDYSDVTYGRSMRDEHAIGLDDSIANTMKESKTVKQNERTESTDGKNATYRFQNNFDIKDRKSVEQQERLFKTERSKMPSQYHNSSLSKTSYQTMIRKQPVSNLSQTGMPRTLLATRFPSDLSKPSAIGINTSFSSAESQGFMQTLNEPEVELNKDEGQNQKTHIPTEKEKRRMRLSTTQAVQKFKTHKNDSLQSGFHPSKTMQVTEKTFAQKEKKTDFERDKYPEESDFSDHDTEKQKSEIASTPFSSAPKIPSSSSFSPIPSSPFASLIQPTMERTYSVFMKEHALPSYPSLYATVSYAQELAKSQNCAFQYHILTQYNEGMFETPASSRSLLNDSTFTTLPSQSIASSSTTRQFNACALSSPPTSPTEPEEIFDERASKTESFNMPSEEDIHVFKCFVKQYTASSSKRSFSASSSHPPPSTELCASTQFSDNPQKYISTFLSSVTLENALSIVLTNNNEYLLPYTQSSKSTESFVKQLIREGDSDLVTLEFLGQSVALLSSLTQILTKSDDQVMITKVMQSIVGCDLLGLEEEEPLITKIVRLNGNTKTEKRIKDVKKKTNFIQNIFNREIQLQIFTLISAMLGFPKSECRLLVEDGIIEELFALFDETLDHSELASSSSFVSSINSQASQLNQAKTSFKSQVSSYSVADNSYFLSKTTITQPQKHSLSKPPISLHATLPSISQTYSLSSSIADLASSILLSCCLSSSGKEVCINSIFRTQQAIFAMCKHPSPQTRVFALTILFYYVHIPRFTEAADVNLIVEEVKGIKKKAIFEAYERGDSEKCIGQSFFEAIERVCTQIVSFLKSDSKRKAGEDEFENDIQLEENEDNEQEEVDEMMDWFLKSNNDALG
ncbi:uncharacterized protein MONOS_8316 [Monocercomonoides exilis]|uniref:uncharacterized protein n=1 Tax=Monocercomonoides exilis TaxID=2049356 RepID=UPI003559DD76|nr:hypothetical protein MONOS_8316 [Monocercomonoides exilis]|eukprot:MONOS_8316.1-p1 / transcript=MONOS_8316.1 / gene=MONOS_8316 / organism=Monocercomonoides_exilis_PA203 / gene_product=unspecified product / transcript_product=unspecified product / location=Mono_scaffold00311:26453-31100(-) / protein_length=1358 / sequence_SO=supercontig / SO=protein_coding / is_pseudo=false